MDELTQDHLDFMQQSQNMAQQTLDNQMGLHAAEENRIHMENMNMKVEGKKFLPPKESKVLGGIWDAEKRQCTVQNGDIKTTYSFVGKPNVSGEMFVSTMHYNKDGAAVVLDQKTGKWRNMNFVDKYKAGIDTKSTVGTVKAYKGERKQGDMLVMYSAADLNLKKFDRPMIRFGEKIASAMPIKIK